MEENYETTNFFACLCFSVGVGLASVGLAVFITNPDTINAVGESSGVFEMTINLIFASCLGGLAMAYGLHGIIKDATGN